MKILKVIHGYPMRYNAGSEVYTQTLCHELARRHHEVHVFSREEDAFSRDFHMRTERDVDEPRVTLHLVNNPRYKDRYRATGVDQRFAEVLDRLTPDIVHVGHLNHLSTSMLAEAATRAVPVVYTLHDYWLMCPRGQFMQMFPENPDELWTACDGQEDRKCAERCYARYFSGAPEERAFDVAYWADWVGRRMAHVKAMAELVDTFIAPSRYLLARYRDEFGLPAHKLTYLDYGFDTRRMEGRTRAQGEPFTFGYIGTHIPAKGIHDLIAAFCKLSGDVKLRIWGRPRGQDTVALQARAADGSGSHSARIEWMSEYRNQDITQDVFNQCDAIVVPSIWVENSPLVIHEAQQARLPIITADVGGMSEYVHHEVNGLLFTHRSPNALAVQMQRFVDAPELATRLGARGYLHEPSGNIPGINTHVTQVEHMYQEVLARRSGERASKRKGPWRITFDTNPDTCNMRCIMCEEHSPYSPLQAQRREQGRARRVMPFELLERVVADAAPHGLEEIIPSTMGEPLLYARFEELLALCERYTIKLNLTTNGTFPRLGARQWAQKLVPWTSDIKISWNGATKHTYEHIMRGGRWEKALEDVKTFIEVRDAHARAGGHRCRVTFQLTFLEQNVDELADMVRLAISLGVDRVKGHHLWAHFAEIEGASMRRDTDAIRRWNKAVLDARAVARQERLPHGGEVLLEHIFLLDEEAPQDIAPGGPCPFLGEEAWVSAQGRFNPCCAPDAQRRTLGDFGDLNEDGFMQIWRGGAYARLVETYQNNELCRGCTMRRPVKRSEP